MLLFLSKTVGRLVSSLGPGSSLSTDDDLAGHYYHQVTHSSTYDFSVEHGPTKPIVSHTQGFQPPCSATFCMATNDGATWHRILGGSFLPVVLAVTQCNSPIIGEFRAQVSKPGAFEMANPDFQ